MSAIRAITLALTLAALGFGQGPAAPAAAPQSSSPGFLALVQEAKSRIKEVSTSELKTWMEPGQKLMLIDVREDSEWQAGHAAEAAHLGKGILERDLEKLFPDPKTEIIMYCGGGFRSALTCDAAQKMGYRNVHSLIGGYKGLVAVGWPMKSGE